MALAISFDAAELSAGPSLSPGQLTVSELSAGTHLRIGFWTGEAGPETFNQTTTGVGAIGGGSSPERFDGTYRATDGRGAVSGGENEESYYRAAGEGGARIGGSALESEPTEGGAVAGGFHWSRVRTQIDLNYDIRYRFGTQIEITYARRVRAAVAVAYGILQSISKATAIQYTLRERNLVQKATGLKYGIRLAVANQLRWQLVQLQPVRAAVELRYGIRPMLRAASAISYNLRTDIAKAVQAKYSILPYDKVRAAAGFIYSILGSSVVNITDEPYITYEGRQVRIVSGDISASEGGYAWEGNFVLADARDYVQFRKNQPFSATLYGETFEFLVDGKELNRGAPAQVGMRLIGISPSAQFVSPRDEQIDREWDTAVQAEDVFDELTDNEGDWEIVDWRIPAFRLSFTDSDRIEVIKRLAEAAGGVVETNLDGTLRVRPKYPVSPVDYATATPAHTFIELQDIFSVQENYNYGKVANKFRLMDVEQSIQDSMEWVPDYEGALSGYIRVYPSPWRTNLVLTDTGTGITIGAAEEVQRTLDEELVEVFKGQGSVSSPIYEILSYEWEATNLGGIAFNRDSRDFTVVGPAANGLVRIVYRTRSLDYRVSSSSGRPTQFLLESA